MAQVNTAEGKGVCAEKSKIGKSMRLTLLTSIVSLDIKMFNISIKRTHCDSW